jgi:hypothetical protein
LHGADDEAEVELLHLAVAVGDHLGEVVPGVDMYDRERQPLRPAGLDGEVEQYRRVLAAGEQEGGFLELGHHFTDDVDGLGFELVEMREPVRRH